MHVQKPFTRVKRNVTAVYQLRGGAMHPHVVQYRWCTNCAGAHCTLMSCTPVLCQQSKTQNIVTPCKTCTVVLLSIQHAADYISLPGPGWHDIGAWVYIRPAKKINNDSKFNTQELETSSRIFCDSHMNPQ